jgi:HAD superfamily phosphoserine phosphatase-like hydrolase
VECNAPKIRGASARSKIGFGAPFRQQSDLPFFDFQRQGFHQFLRPEGRAKKVTWIHYDFTLRNVKHKSWSKQIWTKIEKTLEQELATSTSSKRPIAAFDADGTLWDTDLGEAFFKYQIAKHVLPNLPENPWKYYRDWKESADPRPAYLWLAQINKSHKITEVRTWAEEAVRTNPPLPIFEDQKKLIELFLANKVEVYVITASVSWAVEPGAKRLGIAEENVIGVHTKVKNGVVTDEQEGIITYREGKIAALLEKTAGRAPFFASGNTMGDLALLESAKLGLAVGAAQEGQELFATEEHLRQEAHARNWLVHRF